MQEYRPHKPAAVILGVGQHAGILNAENRNVLKTRVGQHAGMVGQHKQEWWVNMVRNLHIKPLTFDECTFNEEVDIGNYQNAGHVTFHSCTFNRSIKVEFGNTYFKGNCSFNNDLTIKANNLDEVELFDYVVTGTLEIDGSPNKISLKNINHGQGINDQKIVITANTKDLSIQAVTSKVLQFSNNTKFNGIFNLMDVEVSTLSVGDIQLDTTILIKDCNIFNFQIGKIKGETKSISIDDSIIGEMSLKINILKKILINGGSISNLEFSESNEKDSIVNIDKTTIVNLKFERVFNNGLITLRELRIPPKGLVSFKSSNLGKADFIYCNFSRANLEFEIAKSLKFSFQKRNFPKGW